MKVAFHTNTLNYRGTTVAITDYAKYNQEILGNESIIFYNAGLGYEKDMGSEQAVVDDLKTRFNVTGYVGNDLGGVIEKEKADVTYFITAGQKEILPTTSKTAVHAVFQFKQPFGDRYAYISKWLSDTMTDGALPFVPHIVQLPKPQSNYRQALGLGIDKIVVGRIGGFYTFDIPWVKQKINSIVSKHDNVVFLFVGTEPFIDHPNVKFINEIHNLQKKANFIETCDCMLHARQRGESFGLSIAEFLFLNKPVIAWNGGHDKNHLEMLKGSGLLYNNSDEMEEMILNIKTQAKEEWSKRVEEFNPETVMKKFEEVFL